MITTNNRIFGEHGETVGSGRTFGRTSSGHFGLWFLSHAVFLPKAQLTILDGKIPRRHWPRRDAFDEAEGAS